MAQNSVSVQSLENLSLVQEDSIPGLSSNVPESQLSGDLIQELLSNLEASFSRGLLVLSFKPKAGVSSLSLYIHVA